MGWRSAGLFRDEESVATGSSPGEARSAHPGPEVIAECLEVVHDTSSGDTERVTHGRVMPVGPQSDARCARGASASRFVLKPIRHGP
jgi:hypothetical protein